MKSLSDYINAGFVRHTADHQISELARHAAKWWLDFVRNFIVVVGFFYLARKSGNSVLQLFSYINCLVLLWYLTSYFNTWSFRFFPYIKNPRLLFWVNVVPWLIIYMCVWSSCIFLGTMLFKSFQFLQAP